jgi:hypothetical protein
LHGVLANSEEFFGAEVDDAREDSWSRCFEEIGHTWAPSLPKWEIEVIGQSALCSVLLLVDVSMESRILGSRRLFLAWLPSLSLEKSLPCGPYVTWFNLPTWGGAGFIPPLSKGDEAPEAVYLALVEKVRFLRDDHTCHVC